MDIGGFRDMHRHRRCTQIIQGFTTQHGYESPGSADLPPTGSETTFWPKPAYSPKTAPPLKPRTEPATK